MGAEEQVYHVDEFDQELGTLPISRDQAHQCGLYHRSVHVLLTDSASRLILQRRQRDKEINPGAWTSTASGHVEYGSSYDATAAIEVAEETGLQDVRLVKLTKKLLVARGTSRAGIPLVCRAWAALYTGTAPTAPLVPQESEVAGFAAYTLAEIVAALEGPGTLDGQPFANNFAAVLTAYREWLDSLRGAAL